MTGLGVRYADVAAIEVGLNTNIDYDVVSGESSGNALCMAGASCSMVLHGPRFGRRRVIVRRRTPTPDNIVACKHWQHGTHTAT